MQGVGLVSRPSPGTPAQRSLCPVGGTVQVGYAPGVLNSWLMPSFCLIQFLMKFAFLRFGVEDKFHKSLMISVNRFSCRRTGRRELWG